MNGEKTQFDVLESIRNHIDMLRQYVPQQAVVCIGEYPTKILLKENFVEKIVDTMPLFIGKSSKDIIKWSQSSLNPDWVLGLDAKVDTHFWFHVSSFIAKDDSFIARLKDKSVEKVTDALMVSSLWDGVASALLPALAARFREWNINSVALAILPSKLQPSDVHFNALSSLGMCASQDSSTVLLIDRDHLESFVGVNRDGSVMKGNVLLEYLLELMLSKDTLVQELSELSRSFGVKVFTVLSATGASPRIYGSLENILNTALSRPLLAFDVSTVSLLYVLVRMPLHLKDKLPRGKIELSIASWFKEKASLKSIYVTEPIYVDEVSDRVDVVMFVGGFDKSKLFASMEKKAKDIESEAVNKGLIKEEDWQGIVKSLAKD
ncbi:hypothetical protein G4O51_04720 [Candidatus Bathyarchaeota archaeon A05DMB-2]|jgi:hypothetical protein|nr:hypothetical protein [Candidatus Bathyarchaeota archaeon A05DMB-2]